MAKKLTSDSWHKRFLVQSKWTEDLRGYFFERALADPGKKILEVGCGTGAVLSQVPVQKSAAFGLDLNMEYLAFCRSTYSGFSLTCGDGHHLPYSENSFDIVYCHFLLLWVKNPIPILSEFLRVGKPGGMVLLFAEPDYGGRIDYPTELIDLGKFQTKSLIQQGAETNMGRRLKEIATEAGLRITETGIISSRTGNSFDQSSWESEWQMIEHDLGKFLSDKEISGMRKLDHSAWMNGIRTLFIPTFFLAGKIPE